jgi:hypothetical protein
MKGMVADLLVDMHGKNGFPSCLEGTTMDFGAP